MTGRGVLVTGGTGGLGGAAVLAFANAVAVEYRPVIRFLPGGESTPTSGAAVPVHGRA